MGEQIGIASAARMKERPACVQRADMRVSDPRSLAAVGALVYASACDYTRDYVAPSCYGEVSQAGRSASSTTAAISGKERSATAASPGTAKSAPASGSVGSPSERTDSKAAEDSREPSPTADGTTTEQTTGSTTSGASSCDMTGKWLVTLHRTTDGLGNLQTIHDWLYYEIAQQGDTFSVTKSLRCGTDVVGGGAFAITVDYAKGAPKVMQHVSHDGRTGSSVSDGSGCQVDFDKQYTVVGATLPYYLDPSTVLPNADQMATEADPGWEDWDEDGKPGITGYCNGTIVGEIYTAARDWNVLTGSVPGVGSVIKLSVEWDQEPNVMAFEGSPFLGSTAVRAADPTGHFVELARLNDEQASGDDSTLCQRLIDLAPSLTPEASESVM